MLAEDIWAEDAEEVDSKAEETEEEKRKKKRAEDEEVRYEYDPDLTDDEIALLNLMRADDIPWDDDDEDEGEEPPPFGQALFENFYDDDNNDNKKQSGQHGQEQKVADRVSSKGMSKEDAEKEVAKEAVEEKTGYSADALAEVGKSALRIKDVFERPDSKEVFFEMDRTEGASIGDMLEKMADGKVAEDIVKSGLGSEHLATGKGGLEEGAKAALDKIADPSAQGMRQLLADAAYYGKGMSLDEAKNMTVESLKEHVEKMKEENESGKEDSSEYKNNDQKWNIPLDVLKNKMGR